MFSPRLLPNPMLFFWLSRFVRRSISRLALLAYVSGFILACSSAPSEPTYARVTIRVENAACDAVSCAPLSIVGLPKDQPVLRDGPWFILLGTMRSPTACFSFPLTETFTFQDQQGLVEHLVWRNDDSVAIGIFPESSGYAQTKRITGLFVPNRAPGWHVTVPAGTDLVADSTCASPTGPTRLEENLGAVNVTLSRRQLTLEKRRRNAGAITSGPDGHHSVRS